MHVTRLWKNNFNAANTCWKTICNKLISMWKRSRFSKVTFVLIIAYLELTNGMGEVWTESQWLPADELRLLLRLKFPIKFLSVKFSKESTLLRSVLFGFKAAASAFSAFCIAANISGKSHKNYHSAYKNPSTEMEIM